MVRSDLRRRNARRPYRPARVHVTNINEERVVLVAPEDDDLVLGADTQDAVELPILAEGSSENLTVVPGAHPKSVGRAFQIDRQHPPPASRCGGSQDPTISFGSSEICDGPTLFDRPLFVGSDVCEAQAQPSPVRSGGQIKNGIGHHIDGHELARSRTNDSRTRARLLVLCRGVLE